MACVCPCSNPVKLFHLCDAEADWVPCSCHMCGSPQSKGRRCIIRVAPERGICGACRSHEADANREHKRRRLGSIECPSTLGALLGKWADTRDNKYEVVADPGQSDDNATSLTVKTTRKDCTERLTKGLIRLGWGRGPDRGWARRIVWGREKYELDLTCLSHGNHLDWFPTKLRWHRICRRSAAPLFEWYRESRPNVAPPRSDAYNAHSRSGEVIPQPWEKRWSDQCQTPYYFNTYTGESQWEPPAMDLKTFI